MRITIQTNQILNGNVQYHRISPLCLNSREFKPMKLVKVYASKFTSLRLTVKVIICLTAARDKAALDLWHCQ